MINLKKAFKFRLYPNKKQEILLAKTFGCVRFVYNKMLAEHKEIYEKYKDDQAKPYIRALRSLAHLLGITMSIYLVEWEPFQRDK